NLIDFGANDWREPVPSPLLLVLTGTEVLTQVFSSWSASVPNWFLSNRQSGHSCTYGWRHRPSFSAALPSIGGRFGDLRNGDGQCGIVAQPQEQPTHGSSRRSSPYCRANCRGRSADAGKRSTFERGKWCPDYRYQYGLSGQKSIKESGG